MKHFASWAGNHKPQAFLLKPTKVKVADLADERKFWKTKERGPASSLTVMTVLLSCVPMRYLVYFCGGALVVKT